MFPCADEPFSKFSRAAPCVISVDSKIASGGRNVKTGETKEILDCPSCRIRCGSGDFSVLYEVPIILSYLAGVCQNP